METIYTLIMLAAIVGLCVVVWIELAPIRNWLADRILDGFDKLVDGWYRLVNKIRKLRKLNPIVREDPAQELHDLLDDLVAKAEAQATQLNEAARPLTSLEWAKLAGGSRIRGLSTKEQEQLDGSSSAVVTSTNVEEVRFRLNEFANEMVAIRELLKNVMDELEKKVSVPTDDDKFLQDAELSNNVSRVATHTAKKTLEAGLTQALPELVKAAVAVQLPQNLDDLHAKLSQRLNALETKVEFELTELDEDVCELQEDVVDLQQDAMTATSDRDELAARLEKLEMSKPKARAKAKKANKK